MRRSGPQRGVTIASRVRKFRFLEPLLSVLTTARAAAAMSLAGRREQRLLAAAASDQAEEVEAAAATYAAATNAVAAAAAGAAARAAAYTGALASLRVLLAWHPGACLSVAARHQMLEVELANAVSWGEQQGDREFLRCVAGCRCRGRLRAHALPAAHALSPPPSAVGSASHSHRRQPPLVIAACRLHPEAVALLLQAGAPLPRTAGPWPRGACARWRRCKPAVLLRLRPCIPPLERGSLGDMEYPPPAGQPLHVHPALALPLPPIPQCPCLPTGQACCPTAACTSPRRLRCWSSCWGRVPTHWRQATTRGQISPPGVRLSRCAALCCAALLPQAASRSSPPAPWPASPP